MLQSLSDNPCWQPLGDEIMKRIANEPLPCRGQGEEAVYQQFVSEVLPYPNGNLHPRFFGWVQGPGMAFANLADMLASAQNPHLAGFNQAPKWVEERVIAWIAEALGFPSCCGGVLESGGTMASVLALSVARQAKCENYRLEGLQRQRKPITVYCSVETHGWIKKAAYLLGIGERWVRMIPANADFQVDVHAMEKAIVADKEAGCQPICIIGTAGTINTGATDDLNALADLAAKYNLWFHVDGAYGAMAALSPTHKHTVAGMEGADSLSVDLHKWMYMPFEIACLLVRDDKALTDAFSFAPSYLATFDRGVIAGGLPFADRGMDLTRSFKALKAWMCLKAYGLNAFAEAIQRNIDQTQTLVKFIEASPNFELLAPAPMNVVCFRFKGGLSSENELRKMNVEILLRLQESGLAILSSTEIDGKFALRFCNVNHRTQDDDILMLLQGLSKIADEVATVFLR